MGIKEKIKSLRLHPVYRKVEDVSLVTYKEVSESSKKLTRYSSPFNGKSKVASGIRESVFYGRPLDKNKIIKKKISRKRRKKKKK